MHLQVVFAGSSRDPVCFRKPRYVNKACLKLSPMVNVDKEHEIDSSIGIADLVLIELMKSDDDFGDFHTSVDNECSVRS